MTEVMLHEDVVTGGRHPELQELDESAQRALARLEVKFRSSPGLPTAVAETARQNAWWLIGSLGMAIYGVWVSSTTWVVVGCLAVALPLAMLLWKWRHTHRYVSLLRAYSLGEWDQVRSLAARMNPEAIARVPLMQFDIDVRLARMAALTQPLDAALGLLEPWRARLHDHRGVLEGRLAGIRFAAGDFEGYLRESMAAASVAPGEVSPTIDLAMALVRNGNEAGAADVLAKLDRGPLPPVALAFAHWAQGLIEQRQRDPKALKSLTVAVHALLGMSAQPAIWTALALCACDRALVLFDAGRIDEARRDIERVWPVLKAHAPPPLMTALERANLLPTQSA